MRKVRFLKDFGCCHNKGEIFECHIDRVAQVWVDKGIAEYVDDNAKAINAPPKNKMIDVVRNHK